MAYKWQERVLSRPRNQHALEGLAYEFCAVGGSVIEQTSACLFIFVSATCCTVVHSSIQQQLLDYTQHVATFEHRLDMATVHQGEQNTPTRGAALPGQPQPKVARELSPSSVYRKVCWMCCLH
jgi:hypothetical protein